MWSKKRKLGLFVLQAGVAKWPLRSPARLEGRVMVLITRPFRRRDSPFNSVLKLTYTFDCGGNLLAKSVAFAVVPFT